ncbi:MAG: HEAT repeat domain-containing protein [Polyangiaceae bacterium]
MSRREQHSNAHTRETPAGRPGRGGALRALCVAVGLCGGVSALTGCAKSSVVNTAMNGDLATLRQQIADAQKAGTLDKGEVRSLAQAVAGREVRSTSKDRVVDRIHQVRSCAGSLKAVLRDRAGQADDAGGEAKLALLDAGIDRDPGLVSEYSHAESGAWRAVAARMTTQLGQAGLRQSMLADGDERVRRAAISASLDARDKRDIGPLLESTRVDPDPLSRGMAARAVGNIGGEQVVLGLKDLWDRADETTRVTIVEAWAMPAAFSSGGEQQLLWVVETGEAMPAVSAAGALVRAKRATADSGEALLTRVASGGAADERSLALNWLPLSDPDALKAVEKASKDPDPQIKAAALARLLKTKQGAKAKQELLKLAKGKSDAAFPARLALARAGESEAAPLLKQDLSAKSSSVRQQAAIALASLADYSTAATALADENPSVRTQVACSILLQSQ